MAKSKPAPAASKQVKAAPAARRRGTGKQERAAARAFEAGRTGRRLRAIPTTSTAINSQIRSYGRNVVARSRYLCANNSYAMAAKESYISALVGSGIKPSSLVKDKKVKAALQKLFLRWTDEADADGLTDFFGLEAIIAAEMFEAGEAFVRMRPRLARDGLAIPLQLQVLPTEMLPYEDNRILQNGARVECGIEFNAIGQRVAYWFLTQHPGEMSNQFQFDARYQTRVPASEVLHLYKPIRAGQIRGIPHTIAGIVTLALLDLYDDAELERKRTAALFGAFVTRPKAEGEEEHPLQLLTDTEAAMGDGWTDSGAGGFTGTSDFSLEPGGIIDLAEGQDVKFSEPADVGTNYESFQYRNLLRAASGFGVPYLDMTGDLRQTSYSSARTGDVKHRRRVEQHQHFVMVFQFCRPIWNRLIDLVVQFQLLVDADTNAPLAISPADFTKAPWDFKAVKWQTPKWDWVDPYKDLMAEKLAVDSGFKSRSDVIEAMGYDPEETDARIRADQTRATEMEIKFIQLSGSVVFSPEDEDTEAAVPGDLGVEPGSAPGDESDDEESDFG